MLLSTAFDALCIFGIIEVQIPHDADLILSPLVALSLFVSLIFLLQSGTYFMRIQQMLMKLKSSKRTLYIIFGAVLLIPIVEVLVHFQGILSPAVLVFIVIIIFASMTSLQTVVKTLQHSKVAPRNLYLKIHSSEIKILILYGIVIFLTRLGALCITGLYLCGALDSSYTLLLMVAAWMLLLAHQPNALKIYSICPTCGHYRPSILLPLRSCLFCNKRRFYADGINESLFSSFKSFWRSRGFTR